MKVLLIEDEPRVSSFIKRGLEENGIQVVPAYDGATGLKLAITGEFDVVILDIVLPEMNGLEVCSKIRSMTGSLPYVLMLTALGTTDDIVEGLNTGADDYLIKPFKIRELLARLNALSRRGSNSSVILKVHNLELNTETKGVSRMNTQIDLTAREFRLLEYLLKNKNKVVSRTDILENVWDVNHDLGTNVVDVYINYLRKKIDHPFDSPLIKTVVGMGYVIKDVNE